VDSRAFPDSREFLSGMLEAVFIDVVAEDDADGIVPGKGFSQRQRRRNSTFTFLISILKLPQPKFFAVEKKTEKVARVVPPRHNEDLRDSSVNKGLDRVEDHGLVVYRHQVLIGNLGDGIKPGP
jgi:hypothetical protein